MRQQSILRHSTAVPRAIAGNIRASTDPVVLINQIKAAVERQNTTVDAMEAALNDHALKLAGLGMGGGGSPDADPTYTQPFASWFRTGRGEEAVTEANAGGDRGRILASLNEGTSSEGGYLAPTEWDRQINKALVSVSPMRRLADVRRTTVGSYSSLWQLTGPGSGWVGETASRPATATPTFAPLLFSHGEIFAYPHATQRMLDDSAINLDQWLTGEVDTEFGKQEALAFLTGDGVNKPLGLLLYGTGGAHAAVHPAGAIGVAASGNASGLSVEGLMDFSYGLTAPYRQNSTWLMNSSTAASIAKLKDGQGNLIWRESFLVGQPSTLLGRPVELDENMPNVAAGTTPIVFGDFRSGYVVNDRGGTKILRDPYTVKGFVGFYCTRRVGGGVKDPNAFRILKIAAS